MVINYRREIPELMKHLSLPMIAVECGVAEGNFSFDLLELGIEKLYSIDAWQTLNQTGDGAQPQSWHDKNYHTASFRLMKFKGKSVIIKGITSEVANQIEDNSCGLIYLDGDHSYEGVKKDVEVYWSKLVSGGILATHDWNDPNYGTKKFFEEFAAENGLEIHYLPEDKGEDAGAYILKK